MVGWSVGAVAAFLLAVQVVGLAGLMTVTAVTSQAAAARTQEPAAARTQEPVVARAPELAVVVERSPELAEVRGPVVLYC